MHILNQHITSAIRARNLSFLFALALLLSNVFLSLKCFTGAERVVVVPFYSGGKFWVEGKKVSSEYLEHMGLFFLKQLLDVTPDSFAFQRKLVLAYVSPVFYGPLKKRLMDEEVKGRKQQLSTHFNPLSVTASPETLTVDVTGLLSSFVGKKHMGQSKDTYRISFTHNGGKLLVKSMGLLNGDEKI